MSCLLLRLLGNTLAVVGRTRGTRSVERERERRVSNLIIFMAEFGLVLVRIGSDSQQHLEPGGLGLYGGR